MRHMIQKGEKRKAYRIMMKRGEEMLCKGHELLTSDIRWENEEYRSCGT